MSAAERAATPREGTGEDPRADALDEATLAFAELAADNGNATTVALPLARSGRAAPEGQAADGQAGLDDADGADFAGGRGANVPRLIPGQARTR